MTISTRTPEGEPLRCMICDAIHLVLVSRPPNDTVCPSCGAHAWMPVPIALEPFPSAEVSRMLPGFLDNLIQSKSRDELSTLLIDGLWQCVTPVSIQLWYAHTMYPSHRDFDVVASRGPAAPDTMSLKELCKIRQTREPLIVKQSGSIRTLVPILQKDNTASVLEMQHSAPAHQDLQQARVRLVRSVGAVAVGTHLLD